MRRKADDYKTLFAPQLGLKDGALGGPKGILAGVSIETFFRAMTAFARITYYNRTLPLPDLLGSGVYLGASL